MSGPGARRAAAEPTDVTVPPGVAVAAGAAAVPPGVAVPTAAAPAVPVTDAPLTCDVVDGVDPRWPELVEATPGVPLFATPHWLRAMEARLGPRVVTIVVSRGGVPVLAALASVQAEPRPGELFDVHEVVVTPHAEVPLTESSRRRRAELAAGAPAAARWQPSLVVMLPGYECAPVGPGVDDPRAAAALVDGAVRWASGHAIATVAWLYTRPSSVALAAALTARGFARVPLTPTWDLPLTGCGLPDLIAGLPHKRRIEARRELRLLDDAGVRIEPVDAHAVFDDLVRLRTALVTKYRGAPRGPGSEERRLRAIVDGVAGGRPHVLLASVDGVPLGFALFAPYGDVWHCLAVGSDYADPRSRLTYFAVAYHRAAEHAFAHGGVRELGYGLGAWRPKRARGCRPTPLTGWVWSADDELAAAACASAAITELVVGA